MLTRVIGGIIVPTGGAVGPFSWMDNFNTYGFSNSLDGHGGWTLIDEGGEDKPSLGVNNAAGGYAFDDFGDGFGNSNGTALTGWNPALGYTYECQVGFFVSGVGSVLAAFAEIFLEMTTVNAESNKMQITLDFLDNSYTVTTSAGGFFHDELSGFGPDVYHTISVTVSPLRAFTVTFNGTEIASGILAAAAVAGRVGMIGYLDGDMEESIITRFGFMSILSAS